MKPLIHIAIVVFALILVVGCNHQEAQTQAKPNPVPAVITRLGGSYEVDLNVQGNPKPVIKVNLVSKKVTDADMQELKGLTELRSLDLNGCFEIGDAGL